MFDSLICRLPWHHCVPAPVLAPEGAWIPPSPQPERFASLAFEGGRPVMDAATAISHNESLFHGAWTWGAGTALAFIVVGMIWVRGFRT